MLNRFQTIGFCACFLFVIGCSGLPSKAPSADDSSRADTEGVKIVSKDPKEGYSNLQRLFNQGYLETGMEQMTVLREKYPDFAAARNFEERLINNPFLSAVDLAKRHMRYLLTRPSQLPAFELEQPSKPVFPDPPVLTRGEFELKENFHIRIEQERDAYLRQIKELNSDYRQQVITYNTAVNNYNDDLEWELQNRRDYVKNNRWSYMARALQNILGDPVLSGMRYDVDQRIYYGKLISTQGRFDEYIRIKVPVQEAQELNSNLDQAVPRLSFGLGEDGKLKFEGVNVVFRDTSYLGTLSPDPYIPETSIDEISVLASAEGGEEGVISSGKGVIQVVELQELIELGIEELEGTEALLPLKTLELDALLKESDEFFEQFMPDQAIDLYGERE